jgi:hypothetical protein
MLENACVDARMPHLGATHAHRMAATPMKVTPPQQPDHLQYHQKQRVRRKLTAEN